MINKENYFDTVKSITVSKLPENLKKGYLFVQQTTQDHSTWKFYNQHQDIKTKAERYFTLLNEFLKKQSPTQHKTEIKLTEKTAREYAKEFIRGYVQRGDSYESIASSYMGTANGKYHANIKKGKIIIDDGTAGKFSYSFTVRSIYDDLTKEKNLSHKKPTLKNETPAKKVKAETTSTKPKTVSINYDHSKPFERMDDEIKFIKRYLLLHGKVKTKVHIINFINALQRAILEKRIRKTSKYAKEIMQIQKQLLTAHGVMGNEQTFELGASTIKHFSEIVGSVRIRLSTQYLKRFVGIQGKNITKEKAKRLLNLILDAIENNKISKSDPYYESTMKIGNALNKFIELAKPNETLEIHQQALNGLNGLNGALGCNCDCNKPKSHKHKSLNGIEASETEAPQVMSVDEAKGQKYNSVPLGDKWKQLLGEICLPTHLFVYGSGGSGKTSFALLFTQHLASLGYKILYVAGEQFDTPPFTKLLNQLNIVAGDNYKIVGKLDTLNPSEFDFVALDTKDSLDIDTLEFLRLKEENKNQSFIVVSHGIKGGDFKGKEQWRNIVDIMVHGEYGVIRTGHDKNRWGGSGEMLIYDHPNQYQIKE